MHFVPKRQTADANSTQAARGPHGSIFPLRTILVLGLVVASYAVVAWALSFYPLAIAHDALDAISIRVAESGVLWFALCTATGWWRHYRGRRAPTEARRWPLTLPLLALGLSVALINAAKYGSPGPGSMPAPRATIFWILLGVGVLGPMLVSAGGAYSLHLQTRWWRVPPDPAGVCPCCNYCLQGNASGRCPECGTIVEHDPSIPRSFYAHRRYWIFPELAEFATPGERYAAWKRAVAEDRKVKYDAIVVIILAGGMALLRLGPWRAWLDQYECLALGAVGAVWTVLILIGRQRMRRHLREQLVPHTRSPGRT